eukprot:Awhi_evm2s5460
MKVAPANVEKDLKEITIHLDELEINKNVLLTKEENEVEGEQQQKDDVYKRAAKEIKEANVLIFLSGAGFSADSGLLVYKDIAHEYMDEGYDYADLCTPTWIEEDPDLFYGFWGSCFNEYRAKAPHFGYNIIKSWRDKYFSSKLSSPTASMLGENIPHHSNFFAITSNVDAHLKKVGFSKDEVFEIHGNSEEWQCSNGICAGRHQLENINLPADYEFKIKQRRAYKLESSTNKDKCNNINMEVNNNNKHDNRPLCPFCGKALRPKIMMFCDEHYVSNIEPEDNFDHWQENIKQHYSNEGSSTRVTEETEKEIKKTKLVILEIGAGIRVPAIRARSSQCCRRFESTFDKTTMIRIGFEKLEQYLYKEIDNVILIEDGALSALEKIDGAIKT